MRSNAKSTKIINDIRKLSAKEWEKRRKLNALTLFKSASQRVPAYSSFLKNHKVDPGKIKTYDDLAYVPIVNKANYIKKYSLEELSWDGSLVDPLVFTSTSGSTGAPTYFSRSEELDWQLSIINEIFIGSGSFKPNKKTLSIVCFGMGVWIGGLIIYKSLEIISQRSFPMSIITPGINKEEIYKILVNLAPEFDQIILAGYPPFIKDVLDGASHKGIDLSKFDLKLLFAAEAFTEKFRDHLSGTVGMRNSALNTMNIYGSADIGGMAFETPITTLIRKYATKKPRMFDSLFSGVTKTPTLTQFIPSFINFESVEGKLLVSGNNSIPLIRYDIGDNGGVFKYDTLIDVLKAHGVDKLICDDVAVKKEHYNLPFVYVYERADLSTSLYGLQIYPEHIKDTLLERKYTKFVSGKFTILTKHNDRHDQYLEVNIELRNEKTLPKALQKTLQNDIVKFLCKRNSEYRELFEHLGKKAVPKLVFWKSDDPLYFRPGIKQRWVKN